MIKTTLTFSSDSEDPFIPYAIKLIAFYCGIAIQRLTPAGQSVPDISYASSPDSPCNLFRIPRVAMYSLSDIPAPDDYRSWAGKNENGSIFPFDLFSAINFWLTDAGNNSMPAEGFDRHQRLLFEYSCQHKRGTGIQPVVNIYLSVFKICLERILNRSLPGYLPVDKKCMLVLTHDVDNPITPGDPYDAFFQIAFMLRQGRVLSAGRRILSLVKARIKNYAVSERYWLFQEVMDAEAELGLQSTFFLQSNMLLKRSRARLTSIT